MATANGSSVTIDESTGLQNALTSTLSGDTNDNDTSLALPSIFSTWLAAFTSRPPLQVALSGYDGSNTGTAAITFSGSSIGFSTSTGTALNGVNSGMTTTAGNKPVLLYTDTTNDNILYGKTSDGTLVFAAYLDEMGITTLTGAKLWMVEYEAIKHLNTTDPDDVLSLADLVYVTVQENLKFSLQNAPSGQNLFLMLGNETAGVVVTGKNPANQSTGVSIIKGDTINTSQGGGTTTIGVNNQMIDAKGKEGIYLTFVKTPTPGFTIPNLDQNEADVESNISFAGLNNVKNSSFQVVQLQGGKAATVTISAFSASSVGNISGVNYVDSLIQNTAVGITAVIVKDASGTVLAPSSSLTVNISGGIATVVGIQAGYTVEYQTSADHNRVLIENTGSGTNAASFDIGGFSIGSSSQSTLEIGSLVRFEDSGPAFVGSTLTTAPVLTTEDAETIGNLSDSAVADFSGAFTIEANFGADGEGSTIWEYSLGVSADNDARLNSNGAAIHLYMIDGKVIGSTASTADTVTDTNTVFDISVNAHGEITLRQFAEIDHALPGTDANFANQTTAMVADKITLIAKATITDGDGDTATSTQSLGIGDKLRFADDGPAIVAGAMGTAAVLTTQDAETISALTDSAAADFSGVFTVNAHYGADGEGSTNWSYALGVNVANDAGLSSHGAAIKLYLIEGHVLGSTALTPNTVSAENTVFIIMVDASGLVTLQQFAAIDHALPGADANFANQTATIVADKISLSATATVTDGDGDTATSTQQLDIGDKFVFADDGPAVTAGPLGTGPILATQDADTVGDLADSTAADFSGVFTANLNYGGDGEGATSWGYALGVNVANDAGLSSNGASIFLYLKNGQVIGSTAMNSVEVTNTNTVFDVSVDNNGRVTLNQFAEIDHALPGADTNFANQTAMMVANKITLSATVTITDGDGDTATSTQSLNIGDKLVFADDGPSITVALTSNAVPVLTTQDVETVGTDTDVATADFSSMFAATADFGADGEGSANWGYALGVNSANDAGLSSNGSAIHLYLIGSKVVGSTASTADTVTDTNTVFDVSVNAHGEITLRQFAEIDHALPGTDANFANQTTAMVADKIILSATATVTDGDGDKATSTQSLNIGDKLRFADDGPAVVAGAMGTVPVLTTKDAETIGDLTGSAAEDFSGVFTVDTNYGADGAGSTSWEYALGINSANDAGLSSNGTPIYLYLIDTKVVGSTATSAAEVTHTNTIFDVSVNAIGRVTLQQFAEIDHATPGTSTNFDEQTAMMVADKITLSATATVTDGDGDTATSTQSLGIGDKLRFADDGPAVVAGAMGTAPVLTTQDAETLGNLTDSAAEDFSGVFTIDTNYGADGAGSTSWEYALGVNSANDTGLNSNGTPIYLYLIDSTVVGSTATSAAEVTDTNTVFDVSVNAIGRVTLQQFAEIDHATPDTSINFDDQTATMVANKITFSSTATITDGDGDTAASTQSIDIGDKLVFADDGPVVVAGAMGTVPVLTTEDAKTIGTLNDSATANFSSVFTANVNYGADGEGLTRWEYALGVNSANDAGLSSNGAAIHLYLIGGTVVGSTASTTASVEEANTIFNVVVAADGLVTLQQFAEIDHGTPGTSTSFDNQTEVMVANKITLSATAIITDGDGDTATSTQSLDIGDKLRFADDGPTVVSITDLSGTNDGKPISGTYKLTVGADAVGDEKTDGIVLKTLTGTTGGGRAIENTAVTWLAEDSASVAYNFSFNYYSGPDATTLQNATGVVTFDKAADGTLGDFTFDMNGLIGGETTFSTSAVQLSYNYDTLGNNSPEIVVQKYSDDFYGVFSAFVPFKPSDSNGLTTVDINNTKNSTFVKDDVFSSQQPAYLNIATNTVGVNSDTLQNGELLNLDFYTSNPVTGATSPPSSPSASINTATERSYADSIKITLNQITDGEDIAVLLKLYNEATSSFTTRLIIANSALDYVTVGSDKVVTIGPEDYNAGYRIYGLQVLTSTENVSGTGYSLQDGSVANLTSAGRDYQDTSDSDVIKIIKIEVVTETTSTYDVDLNFGGAVIDDDEDFADFNFGVHLEMDGLNLVGTTTAPMDLMV